MNAVIGFDVYGTLVDPLAMREPLAEVVGAHLADQAAALWRTKQIEYAFRRAAMRAYEDFSVCTRHALAFTLASLRVPASPEKVERLVERYRQLPAYPDVPEGLDALRATGARLIAFSNGTEQAVRAVLNHAGLLDRFDGVVSVDELRTFKPDPAVYQHLVRRGGQPADRTWLVSANAWDVIGAKQAGLCAAWVKRDPDAVFDPWGIEPDVVVSGLGELASRIAV